MAGRLLALALVALSMPAWAAPAKSPPATPPSAPPQAAPVTRARDLPFTRENVLQVVSSHADEIQGCYESAMARRGATAKDAPSGRVLMSWVITPDGLAAEVKVSKSAIGDSLVTDCMVQAIRFWEFPKPETRQPIEFPFDLKPSNGAKTPKKKEAR